MTNIITRNPFPDQWLAFDEDRRGIMLTGLGNTEERAIADLERQLAGMAPEEPTQSELLELLAATRRDIDRARALIRSGDTQGADRILAEALERITDSGTLP